MNIKLAFGRKLVLMNHDFPTLDYVQLHKLRALGLIFLNRQTVIMGHLIENQSYSPGTVLSLAHCSSEEQLRYKTESINILLERNRRHIDQIFREDTYWEDFSYHMIMEEVQPDHVVNIYYGYAFEYDNHEKLKKLDHLHVIRMAEPRQFLFGAKVSYNRLALHNDTLEEIHQLQEYFTTDTVDEWFLHHKDNIEHSLGETIKWKEPTYYTAFEIQH